MAAVFYEVVQRSDGWHVNAITRTAVTTRQVFPTCAEAEAWCRTVGGIPCIDKAPVPGITIAPSTDGRGADISA